LFSVFFFDSHTRSVPPAGNSYREHLEKEELDERQKLYTKLAEQIWNPKRILADQDGSNTRSTWLTSVLDLLGVCASSGLRGVLSSETAVAFQQGGVRIADFVGPGHIVFATHH
jgi:hypothetical protein